MICNCILNEFELWMCYKIFYFGLVYSGLCWVLNKICRFKCENNTKTKIALKKHHIRPRFIPELRQKAHIWCRVEPKPRPKGDRIIKNKLHIWLQVEPKLKQKVGLYGLGCLWTEAEEGSMASVLNWGQKLSTLGLAPICFGSRTDAEY